MTQDLKHFQGLWLLKTEEGYEVGLTNETQEELGSITFASFPKVGQLVKQGESLIEVEAEKSVSEFSSPVSGTIVSINEAAEKDISILDAKDHNDAWIAIIDATEEGELA